jgi:hypothetical protein
MKRKLLSLMAIFIAFTAQSQSWSLNGNLNTNPATHFIGTRDNKPLRFRVNNIHAGEIDAYTGRVFLGAGAGQGSLPVSPGFYSIAIGYQALFSDASNESIAIGAFSLYSNDYFGVKNIGVGHTALYSNTTGSRNTAMGHSAMLRNTNGYDNTAYGERALMGNTGAHASYNTAIGGVALAGTTNSQYNTAVGYHAGISHDYGWNNTFLGAQANGSFPGQYNAIAIGQGAITTDNSVARIGNSATWSIGGFAGWTNFSDGRYKKNVQENVKGLDFIMKLRPVTYNLDISGVSKAAKENAGKEWDEKMKEAIAQKEKTLFSGFVAQEVEQAATASGYEFSGVDKPGNENSFYGLRYAEFVVPIIKAMQEQQAMIEQLKKQNEELQGRFAALEFRAGISNKPAANDVLAIYPNPSSDKILVNIMSNSRSQASIKIFDNKGILVKQQQVFLSEGLNQASMDIKNLVTGAYHISAEWEKGQMKKTIQFIKQ